MIRRIHEDQFFIVDHNQSDRVYRVARTAVPFADPKDAERAFAAFDLALTTVPPGSRLLLDLRDAPFRNDDAFETVSERARERAYARFVKVAVLVRTATGMLQMQRRHQGLPKTVGAFDDEDRAFDFLLD